MISGPDVIEQFRTAIHAAGIEPPDHLSADGVIHRFGTNGRADDDSGWYILHIDSLPAGAFGCWRSDISETWRADIGCTYSPTEQAAHLARISEIKKESAADAEQRRNEARIRAAEIWKTAKPAPNDHPYLRAKNVKAHGLRVNDGRLVVPMRDSAGELHSLQFIGAHGDKKFLTSGRVTGCYYSIGRPDGVILIAEGFATGATLHEATGHAVVIAFNTGNLEPAAKALRAQCADIRLIVCADDDAATTGNPGMTKARAAAYAVGAAVAVPDFGDNRPDGVSDFNDLHRLRGPAVIKACVDAAQCRGAAHIVDLVCAAGITPEPISWLWPGWLAGGKLHVLAGPAGTGKTTIALALAATVSTGSTWPDGTHCERPGHVLIWSAEDGVADTLVPRLRAAGADLTKISFVKRTHDAEGSRSFDPAFDIPLLAAECRRLTDVRMLIVDPVVSAVAANSHNNAETRRSLQPLVDFGERLGAAVLGITHFTKGTKGREPLERVTGSLAFGALARIVLGAMKGDDDQRLLVRVKSNIGLDGGGFNYALEYPNIGDGIIGSRVVWGAAVDGDARTLLAESEADDDEDDARSERADAAEWLREILADGPVSAKDLRRSADDAGHAWRTLNRAKKAAGVTTVKEAFAGGWRWRLTPKDATDPQDCQPNWVAPFDDVGILRDAASAEHSTIEVEI